MQYIYYNLIQYDDNKKQKKFNNNNKTSVHQFEFKKNIFLYMYISINHGLRVFTFYFLYFTFGRVFLIDVICFTAERLGLTPTGSNHQSNRKAAKRRRHAARVLMFVYLWNWNVKYKTIGCIQRNTKYNLCVIYYVLSI